MFLLFGVRKIRRHPLEKPVVFIEPKDEDIWDEASIPKDMRPGNIVYTKEDLIDLTNKALMNGQEYSLERRVFAERIFKYRDTESSRRARIAIEKRYNQIYGKY